MALPLEITKAYCGLLAYRMISNFSQSRLQVGQRCPSGVSEVWPQTVQT